MPIGIGSATAAGKPGVTVQIAFSTDPNSPSAASPVWTTIPNRVLTVDTASASRSDELGIYQPGIATLTVRNSDGAFNPVNTTGPYYGKLLPYRPIRILGQFGGVTYPIWQGYVERWPQKWTDPVLGYAEIDCVDALTLLSIIGLDSAYASEILGAQPLVYYPLNEQSGSTTAGNQSATPHPPAQIVHTKSVNTATPGTYQFGGTLNVLGAASQSGLQFTGTNNNNGAGVEDGFVLTLPPVSLTWTGWTLELWCQIPKTPAQYAVIFQAVDSKHFSPLTGPLGADPPGKIALYHSIAAGSKLRLVPPNAITYLDTAINFNLADGQLHHVVVAYSAPPTTGFFVTGTATIYVDGAQTLTATFDVSSTATVNEFVQVGGVAVNAQTLPNSPLADGAPLNGTVGHVALYPTVLPIATVVAHYHAGADGFQGETSGQRAQRLLAYGAWWNAYQQLQQGRSTMGPAAGIAGTVLLSALQDVADTELGTLTVTANGVVDFRSRDDRLLKTASTLTFGPDPGQVPYNLPATVFDYDPTLVFNDIQVTRATGLMAEASDATSITRFFPRTKQLTMNLDTDQQAQDAAAFVLQRESEPHLRVETLTVNMVDGGSFPTVWPALLTMALHDRVSVKHRPMGAPETDMDGFVEQITHHIDGSSSSFAWDVTVQISPVLGNYWIWDDSNTKWDQSLWAF